MPISLIGGGIALCGSEKTRTKGSVYCRVALFTRGLPLRILMVGTLTGLQWGIYDAFKVYVGL